ncbi:GPI inositol deacylase, variant 2 [Entomophthora muscae]|nr:GPI inositol deacylase, variant 2 [Entomophthora muscae]
MYSGSAKNPAPTAVLVIGHSMGGVVARAAIRLPNYKTKSINTIITLSTPHTDARVPLEKGMWDFYREMNGFWAQHFASDEGKGPLEDISLISLNGGDADDQISSDLTEVNMILPKGHGFTASTSSLPNCWVSVEHQVILWCNQVVESIVSALNDVVLPKAPSRTLPLSKRIEMFSHHFLETPLLPTLIEIRSTFFSKDAGYLKAIDLTQDAGFSIGDGIAVTSSLPIDLYTCRGEMGNLQCQDISSQKTLIPASDIRSDPEFGKTVYHHWEIQAPNSLLYVKKPSKPRNTDFIQVSRPSPVPLLTPSLWDLIRGFTHTLSGNVVSHWRFRLPDSPILVYSLAIHADSSIAFILQQANTLINERKAWISSTDSSPIRINFHGSNSGASTSPLFWQGVEFRLWKGLPSDKEAKLPEPIQMHFRLSFFGTLGRILKRLDVAVVVFPFLVFLLVLRLQLQKLAKFGLFSSFLMALRSFSQAELIYWLLFGGLLPIVQHLHRTSHTVADNSPLHSRNWLLGPWGLTAAWILPFLITMAAGWLVILFLVHFSLRVILQPFWWGVAKLHPRARWALIFVIFLPHPIVHVIVLLASIIQTGPAVAQYSKQNMQSGISLFLLMSLPCHLPWLIVFFQGLARGILPDLSLHLSNALSIPLVLATVNPISLMGLQRALSNPNIAFLTQIFIGLASVAVLVWGMHAAFIVPYVCVILVGWLWLISNIPHLKEKCHQ